MSEVKGQAMIKISLKEGTFDLSGSEDFVSMQMQNIKEIIVAYAGNIPNVGASSPQANVTPVDTPDASHAIKAIDYKSSGQSSVGSVQDEYENVFDIRDEAVNILADIPGNGHAEKMLNVALLYALGKSMQGIEVVTFKEIRQACQKHACLDAKNFASKMREEKHYFIVNGSKGNLGLRLTAPGLKYAKNFAAELNSHANS